MDINSIDKIAMIGSGWLGSQIAHSLKEDGFNVISTRRTSTTDEDTKELRFPTDNYSVVEDAELFIIAIPPSKIEIEDLKKIRNHFKDRPFILISSTSVFDKSQGFVNELTEPTPSTDRGIKNLKIENIFINDCIIRCGGLIGPDRHPINSLQHKSMEGEHYLNLIHSEDIIQIIKIVLNKNFKGIINTSFQTDMSKKDYYSKYALLHGFEIPTFIPCKNNGLKINSIILESWNYKFKNNLF